ncbi:hypothetical protein RRG08_004965 [Elysia crispata]|uniref:Uncharacterized protein n=1 Tax=Elysia crispata TaxID=231223 RepID=A0AAE0ZIU9_9GAST|nr:hypothetical protein RRG08_004965 [Elysia crispata]
MGNKKKYKHHIKYNDFTDNEHWTQEEDPNRALPDAVLIIGRGLPGWLFRGRESPLPSALISNGARLLSMHVYPPLKTRRRTRYISIFKDGAPMPKAFPSKASLFSLYVLTNRSTQAAKRSYRMAESNNLNPLLIDNRPTTTVTKRRGPSNRRRFDEEPETFTDRQSADNDVNKSKGPSNRRRLDQ